LSLHAPKTLALPTGSPTRIGEILLRDGVIKPGDLVRALALQQRENAPLGAILRQQNKLSTPVLLETLARQWGTRCVDLNKERPDPALLQLLDPELCLRHNLIPWKKAGDTITFATSAPHRFAQAMAQILPRATVAEMVVAPSAAIHRHLNSLHGSYFSAKANTLCPAVYSCRTWAGTQQRKLLLAGLIALFFAAASYPAAATWIVTIWVFFNLVVMSALRLAALWERITSLSRTQAISVKPASVARLPSVSILVPLYKEDVVLPQLITRLKNCDYPKELLEICLILEANDGVTRRAAACLYLPKWMRIIEVPVSKLQTKPRAMNYALGFCKGEIIGIYDAEDAPDVDQIYRIVNHFRNSGPDVACVQGYLDFYNARQNWLSRCFTIEYAIWFRVILHGLQRLGLPVPLGGTTVFFRRNALENLGAWDAHNVTEDADLGMRLARLGYRCEFVPTVTYEEANCLLVPWIKQRSRWLKGYAMTWATHMRNPLALWRDLGPLRFLGFQILLFGTLSTFMLAPVVWSLWWQMLGGTLPFVPLLPDGVWHALAWAFIASEVILIGLGLFATSGPAHRHLWVFVPLMIFYWPLATIAFFKAVYEIVVRPFYWDKTAHG